MVLIYWLLVPSSSTSCQADQPILTEPSYPPPRFNQQGYNKVGLSSMDIVDYGEGHKAISLCANRVRSRADHLFGELKMVGMGERGGPIANSCHYLFHRVSFDHLIFFPLLF
jgi:hypothetical protein